MTASFTAVVASWTWAAAASSLGVGLDHFLGHLVLGVGEVDRGLCSWATRWRTRDRFPAPRFCKRPDDAHFHVEASAVEMRAAVGAAAENAAVEEAAGAAALAS